MVILEEGEVTMLMEDSKLRNHAKMLFNREEAQMDAINSEPEYARYIKECNDSNDEIISLLNKCNDFNVFGKQRSENINAHVMEDTRDEIHKVVDMTLEIIRTWFGWDGLVKELKYEFKVAYDKFMNLRKKYYGSLGSGLVKENRGNEGSELIKTEIGKDIQDYVKYGINISLQRVRNSGSRARWVRKIAIHFEMLAGLDVRKENDIRRLAEDVSLYKQCMLDFGSDTRSGSNPVNSKEYLMLLQKGGVSFSDIIERKKNELGFEGEFDRLKDSKQLEVYQCMINEFGGETTSNIQFADFIFGEGRKTSTLPEMTEPTYFSEELLDDIVVSYGGSDGDY
ncbi:uncharacterized protein LOC141596159 isoform X2 [Silene latifolia]|uniref:uncharacterized protein LOC141596159 isoform X2 n=1 Tax=Silene latifolia TaxID=37657 RepID=UPI003D7726EF